MSVVKLFARTVLLVCSIAVMPSSAELRLDLVEVDAAESLDATPKTGVKVRSGGGQGGTRMHWMAFNGDAAGIRELIISGGEINERVKTGSTPLHLAAYNGHVEAARVLVEHGARVNARTKAGITPLDWARRNGHEEVVTLLTAHGAKAGKTRQLRSGSSASGQNVDAEAPLPAVVGRRSAPLKYSLMQIPKDSVVVINHSQPGTGSIEKPVSTPAGYRIQLGAFSSEQRAVDAWAHYRKQFPEALGARTLILDEVTVKGKGYHRVQTGPMSRAEAWGICAELKKAGQSCAVMKRGAP